MFEEVRLDTVQVLIELLRDIFSAIREDPESFVSEMRLAAAIKWYEIGQISQARAAEVAGISRSAFLAALQRFGVSPFQYDSPDELISEL